MKTRKYFIATILLAGLVACQRFEAPRETAGEVTFHAWQEESTKTQLKDNGAVLWSPGDAISLFIGSSRHARFTTSLATPSARADFTGSAEGLEELGGGAVWAVYPYSEDQEFNGSSVLLSLPARQQAVAGSFDKGLFLSMARASGFNLQFGNLCGGVKFSVNRGNIKRVRFKGNAGEVLAGTFRAGFDYAGKPKVEQVLSPETEVVLEAPGGGTFQPDTWYYIVTLPVTLSKGYTLSFEAESPMGSRVSERKVTISRSIWGVLEKADGLRVDTDALSFRSPGGESLVSVFSGSSWIATSDASWCTVSPASGSGTANVKVTVSANEVPSPRSANVVFELSDHSQKHTVKVSQEAYQARPEGVDWDRPFHHKSLVMRFTATWCGWCPLMAKAVNLAVQQHPGKLEPVNVHGGGSAYEFSGYAALGNVYGLEGYPTGYVDGRREVANMSDYAATASNIVKYMNESEANYPVSSAIGFTSSLSGRNLSLDVNLFLKEAADYKVTVLLLESGIIGVQSDFVENVTYTDYHHDQVARMAVTNVTGEDFRTGEDYERKDLHYTAVIPSSYVLDNMTVLVYVQRAFGSMRVVGTNYNGYFVDNAVSGAVGTTVAPAVD